MKTLAVRLHGVNDLRLDAFDLPELQDDQILADITSDSICMSSHKAVGQGAAHKRVPADVAEHPIILGHEFCGTIRQVGSRWAGLYKPGQRYSVQPALNIPGREHEAPGYSFQTLGGSARTVIIPREVMEQDCLLIYEGDAFFKASLSEPVSCIIGAFKTSYHFAQGHYEHVSGIAEGGSLAILAGAGPMGLGAIDYALHGPNRPGLLVVTDIDQARLDRAASIFSPEHARSVGIDLHYVDTSGSDPIGLLKALTPNGGYDDVLVFAPVAPLVQQASQLLGLNGCLNFFAGPSKTDFSATINFYDVHYMGHHVVGSSGGNTADMREALTLMGKGALNPAVMITHVGGLDCVVETVLNLPKIPGGKKLVYTGASMPLTALDDMAELGKDDPFLAGLSELVAKHNGLWSADAERYLLTNAPAIEGTVA